MGSERHLQLCSLKRFFSLLYFVSFVHVNSGTALVCFCQIDIIVWFGFVICILVSCNMTSLR